MSCSHLSPREFIYRVNTVLRRSSATYFVGSGETNSIIKLPHLVIDLDAHRVTADDQEVSLTPTEYDLLHYLATERVLSRQEMLNNVWKHQITRDLRIVDAHIKRHRGKFIKVSSAAASMITTVWGFGYTIDVPK